MSASNPYVNKIVFGNEVKIDLTNDTVNANNMLSGVTAHDQSGAHIIGNIATKTGDDVSVQILGETTVVITIPKGYFSQPVTIIKNIK